MISQVAIVLMLVRTEKAHLAVEMLMEVAVGVGQQLQLVGAKIKMMMLVVIVREGRSLSNEAI